MANTKSNITKITIIAMLSAVATILQYLEFWIPLVPSFLKFDFSDLPELIGAFAVGPVGGILIALIKNLLHAAVSQSFGIGEIANFVLGAIFAGTAGIIYKYKRTKTGALIACIVGTVAMAGLSIVTNYFFVYPAYAKFMAMDQIIAAYASILPAANSLLKCLVIFNVPFTLVKGLLCSIIAMLIYKPLSKMFVKLNTAFDKRGRK
ncbi:MAG: ECF transporter S component [Clostridia bacterium]|nr:ECF transporter S component [Clostridia bacterium]